MAATIRTFVVRFLEHHVDEDRSDDLVLAVAEACVEMEDHQVGVSLEIRGGRCLVECTGVVRPGRDEHGELRSRVLESLAPGAEWTGEHTFRFSIDV
ncbi:MAG: ATP-binding protein [Actinomycetota bacterium]|nr:ATP-binding protein [Actinomycetota bacterium]MDH5223958.1 ATP-binding protein [Actinomycetota bacterium]MDH5313292.1 ATP-binding protein [Actinomycetota bacterium]